MAIRWLLLLTLLGLAVWFDWRHRRIPNRLLGVFVTLAIALSLLPASPGLLSALGAALLGAGVFLPLYLLGRMGGGDIKLMGTTGLLVGFDQMAGLCLAVALCGGVLAMVWAWRQIHSPHPGDAMAARMPYALAIAAGTLAQGLYAARLASLS
jgi:Flp pilus assembly protein protease CpaA